MNSESFTWDECCMPCDETESFTWDECCLPCDEIESISNNKIKKEEEDYDKLSPELQYQRKSWQLLNNHNQKRPREFLEYVRTILSEITMEEISSEYFMNNLQKVFTITNGGALIVI
jgi:hypothetical protein